jgi:hypothetical protein
VAELQGRHVAGLAAQEHPGDFSYAGSDFLNNHAEHEIQKYRSLLFRCPLCNEEHGVSIKPASTTGWDWNGNVERPTLSPSIQILGHGKPGTEGCRWHGFLRDGVWYDA